VLGQMVQSQDQHTNQEGEDHQNHAHDDEEHVGLSGPRNEPRQWTEEAGDPGSTMADSLTNFASERFGVAEVLEINLDQCRGLLMASFGAECRR
jgi:hypothetical protein